MVNGFLILLAVIYAILVLYLSTFISGLKVKRLLYKDDLTSLFSAYKFNKKVTNLISHNQLDEYAFCILDIDSFSVLNRVVGYVTGTRLLKYIGDEILKLLRNNEFAAREENDVFYLLLRKDETLEGRVFLLVKRIKNFTISEYTEFEVVPTVVVYCIKNNNELLTDMISKVTFFRRDIKGTNVNIAYYSEVIDEKKVLNSLLKVEILEGLKNNEYEPFYQVQKDLVTGKIIGVEALIRWNHPKRGLLQPCEFLSEFENIGINKKLDLYMLNSVCRYLVYLSSNKGINDLTVSLNFTKESMLSDDLVDNLTFVVDTLHIAHELLIIEVLEVDYIELKTRPKLKNNLDLLKAKGFKVALDDFGEGYTDLGFLQTMPIDILKIDKSLTFNLLGEQSEKAYLVLKSIIEMTRKLGIFCIAEGIEDRQQEEILKNLGCEEGQGFLYSKPLPSQLFEENFLK